ncbi:MAG TPA: DUF3566 domain-containing protein [Pseudonocardia sp.]|nr:DUF3566 domain-containing protein [Pseudonocardia sp.]
MAESSAEPEDRSQTASEPASGAINGQPEAPAAALPPPWQRIPDSAGTGPASPANAPGEPSAGSTERVSPSPRPRPPSRPRGAAAAAAAAAAATEVAPPEPAVRRPSAAQRTDQTELGSARTVSLDPGRYGPRSGEQDAPPPGPEPEERAAPGRSSGGFQMGWPRNRRPRQASLQLKRLDPWSVLKIALVLAVVLYLVWLVAVGVLYGVLDGIGVWDRLNGQYADLVTEQAGDRLISAGRVFGAAAVIGAVNSLLFAVALSVGAFVYNVSADLVGGVEVTLSERD